MCHVPADCVCLQLFCYKHIVIHINYDINSCFIYVNIYVYIVRIISDMHAFAQKIVLRLNMIILYYISLCTNYLSHTKLMG